MTKDEFKPMAAALKTAYPRDGFLDTTESLTLWFHYLSDLPKGAVANAVNRYIVTEKFPPTIADIRGLATEAPTEDWSEAWQSVRKAISKCGYYRPKEALEMMTPNAREVVERMGFEELCLMPTDKVAIYRSQFKQIFESVVSRNKEKALLPEIEVKYIG